MAVALSRSSSVVPAPGNDALEVGASSEVALVDGKFDGSSLESVASALDGTGNNNRSSGIVVGIALEACGVSTAEIDCEGAFVVLEDLEDASPCLSVEGLTLGVRLSVSGVGMLLLIGSSGISVCIEGLRFNSDDVKLPTAGLLSPDPTLGSWNADGVVGPLICADVAGEGPVAAVSADCRLRSGGLDGLADCKGVGTAVVRADDADLSSLAEPNASDGITLEATSSLSGEGVEGRLDESPLEGNAFLTAVSVLVVSEDSVFCAMASVCEMAERF